MRLVALIQRVFMLLAMGIIVLAIAYALGGAFCP